jgi:hypothetical protein
MREIREKQGAEEWQAPEIFKGANPGSKEMARVFGMLRRSTPESA